MLLSQLAAFRAEAEAHLIEAERRLEKLYEWSKNSPDLVDLRSELDTALHGIDDATKAIRRGWPIRRNRRRIRRTSRR